MKINQITPIRYGQSEINKPETDFLPEEEIVIPTKQSQSSTAKILLGAGILATTAAAGITIAKNKKIKKELETALKRVTDAESKIKDAEEKVKKEIKPESEIKPKTKTIVKYIEKDNTEKLIKKYNYALLNMKKHYEEIIAELQAKNKQTVGVTKPPKKTKNKKDVKKSAEKGIFTRLKNWIILNYNILKLNLRTRNNLPEDEKAFLKTSKDKTIEAGNIKKQDSATLDFNKAREAIKKESESKS